MNEQIKSVLINGVCIIAISLVLFVAGTWWRMHTQFVLGNEAYSKGDFTAAVAGYESAIHMYIPFHPAIEQSARQLWSLGEINEYQGDINRALIAYRALRSSFYADRWLVTPGIEWIARCDAKIAALTPFQRER